MEGSNLQWIRCGHLQHDVSTDVYYAILDSNGTEKSITFRFLNKDKVFSKIWGGEDLRSAIKYDEDLHHEVERISHGQKLTQLDPEDPLKLDRDIKEAKMKLATAALTERYRAKFPIWKQNQSSKKRARDEEDVEQSVAKRQRNGREIGTAASLEVSQPNIPDLLVQKDELLLPIEAIDTFDKPRTEIMEALNAVGTRREEIIEQYLRGESFISRPPFETIDVVEAAFWYLGYAINVDRLRKAVWDYKTVKVDDPKDSVFWKGAVFLVKPDRASQKLLDLLGPDVIEVNTSKRRLGTPAPPRMAHAEAQLKLMPK